MNKLRAKNIAYLLLSLAIATVITTCAPMPPDDGDKQSGWGWKRADTVDDAINFLQGKGAYSQPVAETRISVLWKDEHTEFTIFYKRAKAGEDAPPWGWKLAHDADDVKNMLSTTGAYTRPVKDAQIAVVWKNERPEFFVFYYFAKPGEPSDNWGWKRATDIVDAYEFLNGQGVYKNSIPTARIASLSVDSREEFFIFYKGKDTGAKTNWGWKLSTDQDDALNFINGKGVYSGVKDFEVSATRKATYSRHYVFYQ